MSTIHGLGVKVLPSPFKKTVSDIVDKAMQNIPPVQNVITQPNPSIPVSTESVNDSVVVSTPTLPQISKSTAISYDDIDNEYDVECNTISNNVIEGNSGYSFIITTTIQNHHLRSK